MLQCAFSRKHRNRGHHSTFTFILFYFIVIYCYQATNMVADLSFLAAVGDLIFFLCLLRCWGLKNKWDPDIGWWVIKVRQSNQCICAITLYINTHIASSGKCMTTHIQTWLSCLCINLSFPITRSITILLSLGAVSFFILPVALQTLTVQFLVSILLSAHRFILFLRSTLSLPILTCACVQPPCNWQPPTWQVATCCQEHMLHSFIQHETLHVAHLDLYWHTSIC